MNINLTFCGIFRNEQQNIRRVLDIGKSLCGRIVIGVQKSDDATLEIAREYIGGDNVYSHLLEFDVSPPETCKDRIMEIVGTKWTFWLDADEVPSLELLRWLDTFPNHNYVGNDAIAFPRINYINGYHIEANDGKDEQYRVIRNDVRWKPNEQGRVCHIHPIVHAPTTVLLPIYHHRTVEKIEKTTQIWNSMEPSTIGACNQYLSRVKEEVAKRDVR